MIEPIIVKRRWYGMWTAHRYGVTRVAHTPERAVEFVREMFDPRDAGRIPVLFYTRIHGLNE